MGVGWGAAALVGGMAIVVVLGLVLVSLANRPGSVWLPTTAVLLGMAVIMTVPMVAWMRYRGHTWRPSTEMAASMFLPTFAVIAVMWGGLLEDFGTLLVIEHVAMLPSMLVAMLLRRDEYARFLAGLPDHGRDYVLAGLEVPGREMPQARCVDRSGSP